MTEQPPRGGLTQEYAVKSREGYERMSKDELLGELDALLASRGEAAERANLVHELRVHQVELEVQNRNLRDAVGELETLHHRYADLFNFAPVAYFTFDQRGCVVEVNHRGLAKLGLARRSVVGHPFTALARLDSTIFLGLLRSCFSDRRSAEAELQLTAFGREPIWVHVKADPVMDGPGRARHCRMAFTDVTRIKAAEARAESALAAERHLHERLDAITRAHAAVSDAMLAGPADAERALQAMVDEARALVGAQYAAIGFEGSEARSFDPWVFSGLAEDEARAMGPHPRRVGLLAAAASQSGPVRLPDLHEHPAFRGFPAGHPPMTSFLSVPVRRLDRVIGTLYVTNKAGGGAFDEDDERTLQILGERAASTLEIARLREAEARALLWQRAVLEQIPEAVVLVGGGGGEGVSLNAAAKVLFGAPDALDVRAPDGTPLPAGDLPHARAARGESVSGVELRVHRGDGEAVPVVASAAPVLDGRPASAVAVYRDVSAAKRLEQEREEWTSVVAHDLRQPATVISFSAQLLSRFGEGLGAREARSVARIGAAAQVLSRMIDDLLDVTLIDLRRLGLKLKRVDVVALANEIVDRSRPMFGQRAVRVLGPGEAVSTVADPERVAQVMTNLLSNAVKYSDPESDIGLRVARREGEIEVAIDNLGQGMTAEEAARVFQRFYRTQSAQTGTLGGLGLGLYICKGIVEGHGGCIGVESVPGGTTTFWFRLPERALEEGLS